MSGNVIYSQGCGACGPAVTAKVSCSDEYGPEWEYAGYVDSCGMCKIGGTLVIGTKAKCIHTRYTADPTSCCLNNGVSNQSQRTCDPKYAIGKPDCDAAIQQYCQISNRSFTDKICQQYNNNNPAFIKSTKINYCKSNFDDNCKSFANELVSNNDFSLDQSMISYCSSNPLDEICNCINSPIAKLKGNNNPKCYDDKCIRYGYPTQNMQNTSCPNIVTCDQQILLANSGAQLSNTLKLDQNCGQNTGTSGSTNTSQTTTKTNNTSEVIPPTDSSTNPAAVDYSSAINTLLIILLIVFVILGALKLKKSMNKVQVNRMRVQ